VGKRAKNGHGRVDDKGLHDCFVRRGGLTAWTWKNMKWTSWLEDCRYRGLLDIWEWLRKMCMMGMLYILLLSCRGRGKRAKAGGNVSPQSVALWPNCTGCVPPSGRGITNRWWSHRARAGVAPFFGGATCAGAVHVVSSAWFIPVESALTSM
jgi:hypothetical protein